MDVEGGLALFLHYLQINSRWYCMVSNNLQIPYANRLASFPI
jgi:hypothetical protein